jgi:outer membrane lipoprotein SlyB
VFTKLHNLPIARSGKTVEAYALLPNVGRISIRHQLSGGVRKMNVPPMVIICCLATAAALAGCSSTSGPIIDTKGVNMAHYESDLADCQGYSEQVHIEQGVAKGAVAGGAVGAATGAVVGDVGKGAGVGAIAGAARSAQRGDREKSQVVTNCLRGRGYKVLN